MMPGMALDHPIFSDSIRLIRAELGETGLDPLQQQVLERLVHSSGDLGIGALLRFTPGACEAGLAALRLGAPILTDTAMAAAAVAPMARRTLGTTVRTVLEWAPDQAPQGSTRTAEGIQRAWSSLSDNGSGPAPVVLIGSAPTALERLLDRIDAGARPASLIIAMPVGFIGVLASKARVAESEQCHIRLEGTRGGAGLVGAAVNALLRAAVMPPE